MDKRHEAANTAQALAGNGGAIEQIALEVARNVNEDTPVAAVVAFRDIAHRLERLLGDLEAVAAEVAPKGTP